MGDIKIKSCSADLSADISPDYGGMVSQLTLSGRKILRLDEHLLELSPLTAGGIPVLFPFSSKTKDDTYILNGKTYAMPVHGLIKNAAFSVKEADDRSVTLWIDSSRSERNANYPFDFLVQITYGMEDKMLVTTADITNNSDFPMPHTLGWHPYFLATDKKCLSFTHFMQTHYNYKEDIDEPTIAEIDLSLEWNNVFYKPTQNIFSLRNEIDGYTIEYETDAEHSVIVVCTTLDNSVCLEPWCGLPNSINTGNMLKWIAPGETCNYWTKLSVDLVG